MDVAQMQAQIQDLGYTTDTQGAQLDFLNAAYREIHSKERWPFLEAIDQSSSTVPNTPNYTPPMANWRNIDAVRLDAPSSQDYFDIRYEEPQKLLDKLHRDPINYSTPESWTMYASQVWFYPTPAMAYRVSYYYIQEPPDLVNLTDVPLLPVAYHDVIVAGAVCRIAFRERDWIGLELWTQKYETMIKRLEEEYRLRQRQTSSEVQRSGWFDSRVDFPLTSTGF